MNKQDVKHDATQLTIGIIWSIIHIMVIVLVAIFFFVYADEMSTSWVMMGVLTIILLCVLTIAPFLLIRDSVLRLVIDITKEKSDE